MDTSHTRTVFGMHRSSRAGVSLVIGAILALLTGILLPLTPARAADDPTVDMPPARTMQSGSFNYPDYLTSPGDGYVYVSDRNANTVTVFEADTYGSADPVRTIPVRTRPLGLAAANGLLYVSVHGSGQVDVYQSGGAGTSNAVVRTIATGLGAANVDGITVAGDEVFVAFNGLGRVYVYQAGGAGTPSTALRSLNVSLPKGVAVFGEYLYVASGYTTGSSVQVFPRTWTSAPSAVRSITGSALNDPYGIAVTQYRGRPTMLVTNRAGNSVVMFDPAASGAATPRLRIAGPASGLSGPTGIGVADGTSLLVANSGAPKRVALFTESPYISTVSPAAGVEGTAVTIGGQNFTTATSAAIGSTLVSDFAVDSGTSISARAAAASPGLYDVSVTAEQSADMVNSILVEEARATVGELPTADSVRVVISTPDGVVTLGDTTSLTAPPGYPTDFSGAEIAFRGTRDAVNAAIASLTFTSAGGDTGGFEISAAAEFDGVQFNPDNGHYYEFVTGNQTWTSARAAAQTRTLNSLNGYLATVTSAAENAFVTEKTGGSAAWIGGSDQEIEGTWKWMDGPEAGQAFWTPTCGTGSVGVCESTGMFSSWNPGEPNDVNGEDALMILAGGTGLWNDVPHTSVTFLPMIVEYSEADGSAVKGLSSNRSLNLILRETTTKPSSYTLRNIDACLAAPELVNGSFEFPRIDGYANVFTSTEGVGWKNTAEGVLEYWGNGFLGVPAQNGTQFVEMNANVAGTLYQDLATEPGANMRWSLWHRAREGTGTNTMRVVIGAPDDTLVQSGSDLTSGTDWVNYTGTYTVPEGQTITRFAFQAVSPAASLGNLLDNIRFSTVGCAAAPTITSAVGQLESGVITFTPNSDDGGYPISNYAYRLDGGDWIPFDPNSTSSPYTITGLTPGQSYDVQIAAINEYGRGQVSNTVAFTVPAAPVVASVAVDAGRPGNIVTLSGSGFTGASAVTFNGASATFTVDSDTSITATVPPNEVVVADVAVTTDYGTGILSGGFTYLDVPNDETLCENAPDLINGDFEDYQPPTWSNGSYGWVVVPQTAPGIGWKNTGVYRDQPDGIELHKGIRYGAASGEISGELNAYVAGTFYQEVLTVPGTTMRWRLAHGSHTEGVTNTMRMLFGPDLDNLVQSGAEISSDRAAWTYHSGTYTVPEGQTTTIFALQAVTGGDVGNLVDDISYTLEGCAAPPSNLDYLPAPGRARISFTPGDDGGNPVQRYAYSVDGGPWLPVTPDGDTVTIPGLTNHRDHSVRLRPINGFSAGDISDPIIVRPTDRPPVPRLVSRNANALQWAEPSWAGNDDLTTYTVVYKRWDDRNNPKVRWAVYARRTTPIDTSLPLQIEMNATRRNCGPENTALGWNNCPLPIGALNPEVTNGYAFRVFARTATKLGPMSAPVQYIP